MAMENITEIKKKTISMKTMKSQCKTEDITADITAARVITDVTTVARVIMVARVTMATTAARVTTVTIEDITVTAVASSLPSSSLSTSFI